jgi:serine/threonine protein kinase
MVDPLSIAGFVIQLLQLAVNIYRFIDRMRHGSEERRQIKEKMTTVLQGLDQLQLDWGDQMPQHMVDAAKAFRADVRRCLEGTDNSTLPGLDTRVRAVAESATAFVGQLQACRHPSSFFPRLGLMYSLQQGLPIDVLKIRHDVAELKSAEDRKTRESIDNFIVPAATSTLEQVAGKPDEYLGEFSGQPAVYKLLFKPHRTDKLQLILEHLSVLKKLSAFDCIRKFHGICIKDNSVYSIMECAPRGQLSSFMDGSGKLDEQTKLEIAYKLATVISLIHQANYLHKNICLENVLLADDYSPRLTGFDHGRAVSLFLTALPVLTLLKLFPAFSDQMPINCRTEAPEVLNNEGHSVYTDIYRQVFHYSLNVISEQRNSVSAFCCGS